jgi:flagellar M-ring protein FliF
MFAANAEQATASVVVHLVPGFHLREDQSKGIVHLVAASVRGLSVEHVTLVDGDGKRLGGGGDGDSEQASEADGYRREIEKSKERAAQQILDATLGAGKAIVRVSALVNFTREEVTEEHYDPEKAVARSFQISEEREGGPGKSVSGVPGAPSNLPGGEAAATTNVGGNGLTRRSETRNFEVSKISRRAVEPVGRVTGLQVAVVVDGKWRGVGAKRKFEALPQEQLERLSHLVSSAIGVDDKRGDKVVVECVAFADTAVPEAGDSELDRKIERYTKYGELGAAAVGALFVMFMMIKLLTARRHGAEQPTSDIRALAAHASNALGAAQATVTVPGIAELMKSPARAMAAGAVRDDALEQVRLLASELAAQEPEAAARVIRGWLAEGSQE